MSTRHIYVWLGGPVTFGALCANLEAKGNFAGPGFYEIHNRKITRMTQYAEGTI